MALELDVAAKNRRGATSVSYRTIDRRFPLLGCDDKRLYFIHSSDRNRTFEVLFDTGAKRLGRSKCLVIAEHLTWAEAVRMITEKNGEQ